MNNQSRIIRNSTKKQTLVDKEAPKTIEEMIEFFEVELVEDLRMLYQEMGEKAFLEFIKELIESGKKKITLQDEIMIEDYKKRNSIDVSD